MTEPKKVPKPRDIHVCQGFSLWEFEGNAQIDTGGAPEINAEEARKAGKWLLRFADWSDSVAKKKEVVKNGS